MLISFHLLLSFVLGILAVFDRGAGAFEHEAKYVFFYKISWRFIFLLLTIVLINHQEMTCGQKRSQHLLNVKVAYWGGAYYVYNR